MSGSTRTRSSCASPICRARRRRPSSTFPHCKDRVPIEMLGRTRFPAIGELPYMITLAPYGFYWFQLKERDKSEPVTPRAVPEFETLVVPLGSTWVSLARTRSVFERDVLPGHLARTPLVSGAIAPDTIHPTLTSAIPFCDIGDNRPWLAFFKTTQQDKTDRAICCRCRSNGCASTASATIRAPLPRSARARAKARCSMSRPTRSSSRCCCAICRQSLTVEENGLRLEFRPTSRFPDKPIRAARTDPHRRDRSLQQHRAGRRRILSSSSIARLEAGIHPEIEIGRFLTEVAGFANTPALLGTVEFVDGEQRSAIATVHALDREPGRRLDRHRGLSRSLRRRPAPARRERASPARARSSCPICAIMAQAGRRVAELHMALAGHPDDLPISRPRRSAATDMRRWTD